MSGETTKRARLDDVKLEVEFEEPKFIGESTENRTQVDGVEESRDDDRLGGHAQGTPIELRRRASKAKLPRAGNRGLPFPQVECSIEGRPASLRPAT